MKRSEHFARWIGAALGVVGGFTLGYFMVRGAGDAHVHGYIIIGLTTLEGLIFAYLGTPYVLGGWRTFNFRLTSTPLPDMLSGLLGMVVGLIIAVLIGFFVRDLPYGYALSFVLALLLAAQGASVGLTRRAELASLFFGGDKVADTHRLSAVLLDTSVIIDGRILDIAKTGFVDMPLVILSSVLRELQMVADSADATRRRRGRRGLDVLTDMQKDASINLLIAGRVVQAEQAVNEVGVVVEIRRLHRRRPVRGDHLTGDVGGEVGQEEQHRPGDVVGNPPPAERDGGAVLGGVLRRRGGGILGRLDRPRSEGIDPDPERPQLVGGDADELVDRRLPRAVGREVARREHRRGRRDGDERTAAGAHHCLPRVLEEQVHRAHVGVDLCAEVVVVEQGSGRHQNPVPRRTRGPDFSCHLHSLHAGLDVVLRQVVAPGFALGGLLPARLFLVCCR